MKKNRIVRIVLALTLVISMMCVIPMSAEAATEPRYVNTSAARVTLANSNGKAICTGEVMGYSGTTIYLVDMVLDQVSSAGMVMMRIPWYGMSSNTNYFYVTKEVAVPSGFNYRLTLTAVVKSATYEETVSVSAEKQF